MHIEVFVEDISAEAALTNLLPKLLPEDCEFVTHAYAGKQSLLRKLPGRLRGYADWLPDDWHIVVLVDRDADDCRELKARLDAMAVEAGLMPKARAVSGRFHVVNRIAIEELEAWFFGDVEALHAAYSHVPETLAKKKPYRDPDAIKGGTWEALARVLGYPRETYPKIEVARKVSGYMDPARNRSHSFNVFASGIAELPCSDA